MYLYIVIFVSLSAIVVGWPQQILALFSSLYKLFFFSFFLGFTIIPIWYLLLYQTSHEPHTEITWLAIKRLDDTSRLSQAQDINNAMTPPAEKLLSPPHATLLMQTIEIEGKKGKLCFQDEYIVLLRFLLSLYTNVLDPGNRHPLLLTYNSYKL